MRSFKQFFAEGLWANINAKKKRGGKSARKGSKAYKAAKKAGDKLEATKESVNESKEYRVDDSQQDEYLEYQSEFVYDYEAMMDLPHDKLASIITKTGKKRFSASIDGVDPSVDGTEHYYIVTDRDVLKNIASLIASTDEPHHEEFAMEVGTSDSFEFMVRLPKSGFTGEEIGKMEVFLVAPGGSEQLQALLVDSPESGDQDKSDYKLYIDGEFVIKTSDKSRAEYLLKMFKGMHPGKKVELGSNVNENFKDGKKKGKSRPGRVKRAGASCSGSVTSLRKKAKAGGEKGKMYHWCANMKSGKKKK